MVAGAGQRAHRVVVDRSKFGRRAGLGHSDRVARGAPEDEQGGGGHHPGGDQHRRAEAVDECGLGALGEGRAAGAEAIGKGERRGQRLLGAVGQLRWRAATAPATPDP